MKSLERNFPDPAISIDPPEQLARSKSPGRRWLWLGVSLVILAAISGGLAAAGVLLTHEVTSSKTFTVGSTPRLVVDTTADSVQVDGGPAGQIRVVTSWRVVNGNDDTPLVHVSLSSDGNTLTIQGPEVDLNWFGSGVSYTITVPSRSALSIHTDSDISVEGIDGAWALSTTGGDITATDAVAGADSTFRAASGDIRFDGTIKPGVDAVFSTRGGDVDLALPASADFQVRASTTGGSIYSEFSAVNIQSGTGGGAKAAGVVGIPPFALVSITVASGDIHLRSA